MPERQLTIQQKRYLKFAHLFFAALWGGGATTMVLLFCLFHPSTAHEQITFSKILFYIDFIIVGPGAGGCLATGLIYSLYGNWGFFKLCYQYPVHYVRYARFPTVYTRPIQLLPITTDRGHNT